MSSLLWKQEETLTVTIEAKRSASVAASVGIIRGLWPTDLTATFQLLIFRL